LQVSRLLALAFVGGESDADDAAPLSGLQLVQYQLKMLAVLQLQAALLGKQLVTVMATEPDSGELAGVANVSPGLLLGGVAEHLKLGASQAPATLSSLAVAEGCQRRGLGRQLVAACEAAAAQYSPPATLMALSVYRYNEAAVQLYETSGYQLDDSWVDPRWAQSAESGRIGFARRQLMLKPLLPPC
jgi:ribosomal protein S18 acetylase RimI-like enzyme